jgi:hypothetical protein
VFSTKTAKGQFFPKKIGRGTQIDLNPAVPWLSNQRKANFQGCFRQFASRFAASKNHP